MAGQHSGLGPAQMRTRFAPSPTGPLHLGHAFSALCAYRMAQNNAGTFLLRIEDIDQSRARPEWEAQIYADLQWLGLDWPHPVLRQSSNMGAYQAALDHLWQRGLVYPCHCTRRDIQAALTAPQEGDGAPQMGPDGPIYPGTCRSAPRPATWPADAALRLDMRAAMALLPQGVQFCETGSGAPKWHMMNAHQAIENIGDIVLSRRDMGTSYHLSVVVDDAAQAITHVTRGQDLFDATFVHVILQHLLGLSQPIYHHHRLIRDDAGKRLAKRDDARAIARYRDEGLTPADICALVGLQPRP